MAESGDLEQLERILKLMESHEVAALEWEKGGERLSLKTKAAFTTSTTVTHGAPMMAPAPTPVYAPAPAAAPIAAPAPVKAAAPANQKQVVSPFVGTFYRSPSPTTEVYVKDGQSVKRGDVLCIIEAMKLMNEIEAEFPGKVLSVLVENGTPVEFGEPLFLIET